MFLKALPKASTDESRPVGGKELESTTKHPFSSTWHLDSGNSPTSRHVDCAHARHVRYARQ